MKTHIRVFVWIVIFLMDAVFIKAQTSSSYQDLTHYSKVFGYDKNYRIYIPDSYHSSVNRYPVIYFFHGWGGRHFKDDNALLAYEKLKDLINKYQVILVMWDGTMDGIEPRPYNVGYHDNVKYQVQMKDYFPELIGYIDSTYRTLNDRQHRGIIGFSMGGFMALYLGGKYPQMVNAVVSLAGSPEFFVGYPSNHTLYPVRYTFKNLEGMHVRIHNGDSDILYFLNEEVKSGAQWEGFPLDYWKFNGGHMVDLPGETKVFEMAMSFISGNFKQPTNMPVNWTHYDLYDSFNVWGYRVESDKKEPGYIRLRHVDKNGFGIYTPRWLPLGPENETLKISITTPPIYKTGMEYEVIQVTRDSGIEVINKIKSDANGQLTIKTIGIGSEFGIYLKKDLPDAVFLKGLNNGKGKYLKANETNLLNLTLFNRGSDFRGNENLRIKVKTNDPDVKFLDTLVQVKVLKGQRIIALPGIKVECTKQQPLHAEPGEVKIYLEISSGKQNWKDDFVFPVYYDVPYFNQITTDDGKLVRDTIYGQGNGDGMVQPGEKILIYEGRNRLRLFTEDPYVIAADERLADEIIPARWPDGYTLSSVVHISSDCPVGHEIEFLASYETKEFNPIERKVHWGKIKVIVQK